MPAIDGQTRLKRETYLRELDLAHETNAEVFENDTVGGGEEGEDVRDEVLFVIAQGFPVLDVVREVNLLGCPKGCLVLLIPDRFTTNFQVS